MKPPLESRGRRRGGCQHHCFVEYPHLPGASHVPPMNLTSHTQTKWSHHFFYFLYLNHVCPLGMYTKHLEATQTRQPVLQTILATWYPTSWLCWAAADFLECRFFFNVLHTEAFQCTTDSLLQSALLSHFLSAVCCSENIAWCIHWKQISWL